MYQHTRNSNTSNIEAPLFNAPLSACKDFIQSLKKNNIRPSSLDILKSASITKEIDHLSSNIIEDIYTDISTALHDTSCGIVALDIPQGVSSNPTQDTLLGAIIAQAIVNKFMSPAMDRRNNAPFTLYNASKEGESKLKEAGLKFYSPEEKLGFHTDGRIENSNVYIPDILSIYNLLIAYKKAGSFYWLPFTLWNEFETYAEAIGWNVTYKTELTPIVYPGKNGEVENLGQSLVKAPIFYDDGDNKCMFLNGEIIKSEIDIDKKRIIDDLKDSMQKNTRRYYIPQQPRRIILMKNSAGAHSRDIFNEYISGTRYTRSFMRSISLEGKRIGITYQS
ncbi:hypothetical protein SAMN04487958_1211 [Vreelandella subterranea]|uniref:Taurine catabolism dioxygenase TauD, TfdA family n=1 Tax=Vreelandella subterranea TaxID=416874 RepID=A0A1H9WQI6_9GAMM|nr:hypothetical protein [Halomonas subterranea]SES36188.1 hypothetical protein SAMN04487958_1211 [Halomonas subterranea]